jgi:hypothetical protein
VDVAEISGQIGQMHTDVDVVPIPVQQCPYGETVPQIMQPEATSWRRLTKPDSSSIATGMKPLFGLTLPTAQSVRSAAKGG